MSRGYEKIRIRIGTQRHDTNSVRGIDHQLSEWQLFIDHAVTIDNFHGSSLTLTVSMVDGWLNTMITIAEMMCLGHCGVQQDIRQRDIGVSHSMCNVWIRLRRAVFGSDAFPIQFLWPSSRQPCQIGLFNAADAAESTYIGLPAELGAIRDTHRLRCKHRTPHAR